MEAKSKAYELIEKVSSEMDGLPYSYCKAMAKLICDEIMSMNVGLTNGGESVESDEICADEKYWIDVKSMIDLNIYET